MGTDPFPFASSALAMIGYFLIFAALHSLLADPRFKRRARSALRDGMDRWYRLAYNVLALAMMLPFFYLLALIPDRVLYAVPAPWSWLMMAGQVLAALGLLLSLRQTGISYLQGLAELQGKTGSESLVRDGFYCHLRNPLFLFGALFLWLSPIMTQNLLAFNVLAMAYFYIGARHEERSLREEFGQEYEEYREQVPMFIPRFRCR